MFRKLMLASAATLGLMASLAFAPKAEAAPRIRFSFSTGGGYYGNPGFYGRPGYTANFSPLPGYGVAGPGYRNVDNHYHVLFRTCNHAPWREYGTYNCHELAHEMEVRLEARGFEARVEHH